MAASNTSSSSVQRFGGFEVDPRSRELCREGIRIRMQHQPLEVLLLLLVRKGEVVTREELKDRLWPAGTFVDADDGLNTAIRKLREVLGDSAECPRLHRDHSPPRLPLHRSRRGGWLPTNCHTSIDSIELSYGGKPG